MRRGRQDEVSAALAEVQARQQRLARGAVLPRASAASDAAHSTPVAPAPPATDKPRPPAFQWIKRRVVRRSERQGSALEDLGSLELVASASLASARALVRQFVALPPRRDFQFVHPTTGAPVAAAQEPLVRAADLPFLCIALLPPKEAAASGDSSTAAAAAAAAGKAAAAPEEKQPPPPQQTKPRPRAGETGAATRPASATAAAAAAPAKRVPPEATGRPQEQRAVLARSREVKKAAEASGKREHEPLLAPRKAVVATRTGDGGVSLVPDTKRASSAGLTVDRKAKTYQEKSTAKSSSAAVQRGHRELTDKRPMGATGANQRGGIQVFLSRAKRSSS
ncbi:uncharacterized protein IUM83_05969 [Phytophthora cinnamomi]|uniref:uncharacterized protein n=1 Tax=Phytophthora cinnamomi TaxID=4785 RepID=UPI00355ABC29|nr:hypothetical protein IUM83_05969 [Phytophthora cinnamomi]